jgi:hypothetical protein
MTLSGRLVLCARVAAASGWGGSLVVLGLWLMADGGEWFSFPRVATVCGGLAAIAGGMLVFMVVAADRLVPGVGRRQSMWPVEIAVFVVMVASLAGAVLWFRGA